MQTFSHQSQVTPETIPDANLRQTISEAIENFIKSYADVGFTYTPERDGLVVLIEPNDTPGDHKKLLGDELQKVLWEGIDLKNGYFVAVVLLSNDSGHIVIIPDEPWLPLPVRQSLHEQMSTITTWKPLTAGI